MRVFGELVTRGDEFDCSATITFAIPLSAAPAMMPSATLQPNLSFSSSTTSSPPIASTESPLPTLTCTPIYVILNLDDYPEEISWVVRKVNTIGTNDVLKVFNGTLEKDVQQKRKVTVCLSD